MEQVHGRTCDPMGGPHWNGLFLKDLNIIPGCLAFMKLHWRGTDIQGATKHTKTATGTLCVVFQDFTKRSGMWPSTEIDTWRKH